MPDFDAINAQVIEEYRATGGAVGGMFAGESLILVHHRGARSGVERVSPLACFADGGRMFVIASKAGLPENPAWYHNLLAHPEVTVELGNETFRVRATEITGAERDEVFARNAVVRPQFVEYQAAVERTIPVVELVRLDGPVPRSAENCTDQWDDDAATPADPAAVIPWEQARERLAAARLYWAATVRPGGGAPHVRPVFAVWVDGRLYSTTNGTRSRARNLEADPHVSVGTGTERVDLVVEGTAAPVTDGTELERVAAAYRDKYGWPVTVRDGALHAPFGAPAAGPPPYRPYAVTPSVVYAFGTDDELAPRSTRYLF